MWTGPGGGAAVRSTGGKTAEPTPDPLAVRAPGTMLGATCWSDWATRRHSSRMDSALGNRSLGFFRSARVISASTAGGTARLIEDAEAASSWTCA